MSEGLIEREVYMKTNTDRMTRRALAAAAAGIALGAMRLRMWAQAPQMRALAQEPQMEQKPATPENAKRTSLHQELTFDAPPRRIFHILLDPKEFGAMTGMDAAIDPAPGGAFKTFGGLIEGRNVEIIADQRLVQAWRPTHWDAGIYSIVHFELKAAGVGTALVLEHTGFPEGEFDHLDAGWHARYWEPLKKYLAAHA
jgi:activator of HSP90 ATPase